MIFKLIFLSQPQSIDSKVQKGENLTASIKKEMNIS